MSTAWEIKHRLCKAINAHDLNQVLECYSPEAVLVTPAGVAEGHEQISWFYEHLFTGFPDFHQVAWFEAEGDEPAITEWTITGTHAGTFLLPDGRELNGTGRRIAVRAACAAHVANDKILTHREYYDQLELYSQLGFTLTEQVPPAEHDLPRSETGEVATPGTRTGWRGLLRRWTSACGDDGDRPVARPDERR
ncbi:ester cyclase [Actinomadura scrupuli]|uniref:ester cyclase n=1 Tax=Actinomadura scrupuli TaxID=559629 RepID=UPI003D98F130